MKSYYFVLLLFHVLLKIKNIVHEEGIKENSRLHFRTYTGSRPPHLHLSSHVQLHEIYGVGDATVAISINTLIG